MEVYRKVRISSYDAFNWRSLKSVAESGNLDNCLSEGDQIPVTLKNDDKILLDFTHDQNGKAYFVFHNFYGKHQMNETPTNKGGWRDSEMRRYVTEKILPLLPDDLAEVIVPTKIRQIRDGKEQVSKDKLFLLSCAQVFGRHWNAEPDDTQLEIFKLGTNRVKGDTKGNADWWWLRSGGNSSSYFQYVNSGGSYSSDYANFAFGVVLGFCIN